MQTVTRQRLVKYVLGNNPVGWMRILILVFQLTHHPWGSLPCLWEMLSQDGFGFEMTRWQLLYFCIYFLWFANKPCTRWFLLCYKQEPWESSPSWFSDPLPNAIGLRTELLQCMRTYPLSFSHKLSLLVLSVAGEKLWLFCSGFLLL